jgi:hypothetical protein
MSEREQQIEANIITDASNKISDQKTGQKDMCECVCVCVTTYILRKRTEPIIVSHNYDNSNNEVDNYVQF